MTFPIDEATSHTELSQAESHLRLDDSQRKAFAAYADALIPGGAGLPSASEARVHQEWIDRTLAASPDLTEVVLAVIRDDGEPEEELARLRQSNLGLFDRFAFAVSGAYFMNPRLRELLGFPGKAPMTKLADSDEADRYLADGILEPVIERGPIYRPTPEQQ